MTNIRVNRKMRTLEITKKFDKLASRYGTDEYKELQNALAENPGFKVVVRSTTSSKKRETYKGLTFDYMEKYIEAHDNNGTIMEEFKIMRGKTDEAQEAFADSMSYHEIKEWFFLTYPTIAEFHKKREALAEKLEKKKEALKNKENENTENKEENENN